MLGATMPRAPFGPDRPLLVVINPGAGGGRARRRGAWLTRALRREGLPHRVVTAAEPGDAERLAAGAPGPVVAVGGDGTVHAVLNGLCNGDGGLGPLAVLPAGSGDDFARSAGFVSDPRRLAARLRRASTRTVDCGQATVETARGTVTRRFANAAGIGFGADVARTAGGLPLRGPARYVAATLRALAGQRPFVGHLQLDGVRVPAEPLLLVAFCNGQRVGGGLPFAPAARLDDGRLDLLRVAWTSRLGTLSLLGKLVRQQHGGDPRVRTAVFATAEVCSDDPLPVMLDGELVASDARSLRVTVLPGALRLCGLG